MINKEQLDELLNLWWSEFNKDRVYNLIYNTLLDHSVLLRVDCIRMADVISKVLFASFPQNQEVKEDFEVTKKYVEKNDLNAKLSQLEKEVEQLNKISVDFGQSNETIEDLKTQLAKIKARAKFLPGDFVWVLNNCRISMGCVWAVREGVLSITIIEKKITRDFLFEDVHATAEECRASIPADK